MEFLKGYVSFFNIFISIYVVIYVVYIFISSIVGALYSFKNRKKNALHNYLEHEFYYPMSIIVPAYNEGRTVIQTINNLLKLDYHRFEIVIVDDGSTDNTKEIILNTWDFKREANRPIRYQVVCQRINEIYTCNIGDITLTLVSKENGKCKADAFNAGINVSKYPYFVNMDADEILQKDALRVACSTLLEKDNIIGIGGNLKISNDVTFKDAMPIAGGMGHNPIVNMQILEYSRSFQGARIFQNLTNTNLIISGGYGIFKKEAVCNVGGYDPLSRGEDMEMTTKLHHYYRKKGIPYNMAFVPNSICWTQGPANFKDLRNQRQRWHAGLLQTLLKYKTMAFNPRYGLIGLWMIPYMIFYELLSPIISVMGLVAIVSGFVMDFNTIVPSIYMYAIFLFFNIVLTIICYMENRYVKEKPFSIGEFFKVLFYGIIDAIFFRPLLALINFFSFFKYGQLTKSNWVSPTRVNVKEDD